MSIHNGKLFNLISINSSIQCYR